MSQTPTQTLPKVEFPPGTPNWVDISSPDLDATRRFYTGLFGWTAEVREAGRYMMFRKDGALVAGAGSLRDQTERPHWGGYIATADAVATAARVRESGGHVVVRPTDVRDLGRTAVFRDPEGASFAVWQPRQLPGVGLVHAPGAMTWLELMTRHPEQADRFYRAVFDWAAEPRPMPSGGTYTTWKCGDDAVAGGYSMSNAGWMADLPPQWVVYFQVEDCDGTAATARRLGASVMVPPTDIEPGRFAMLRDPEGAAFAIITLNPDYHPS